jgi:hypothetical protein
MQSAIQHPQVVSNYLAEEIIARRLLGPFSPEVAQSASWHISRFGVIPKQHKLGQWWLIVDLSFPGDASVNNGIDPSLCSLTYTKVEEVAQAVFALGRGTN